MLTLSRNGVKIHGARSVGGLGGGPLLVEFSDELQEMGTVGETADYEVRLTDPRFAHDPARKFSGTLRAVKTLPMQGDGQMRYEAQIYPADGRGWESAVSRVD